MKYLCHAALRLKRKLVARRLNRIMRYGEAETVTAAEAERDPRGRSTTVHRPRRSLRPRGGQATAKIPSSAAPGSEEEPPRTPGSKPAQKSRAAESDRQRHRLKQRRRKKLFSIPGGGEASEGADGAGTERGSRRTVGRKKASWRARKSLKQVCAPRQNRS